MLEERRDMPLVILSARWALAAEGSRPAGEPGTAAILARPGQRGENPDKNFSLFRPGLEDTVSAILETGREVLLVGDVPEFGWSVPERLADHLRYGTPLPKIPTLDDVARRNRRADDVLSELAEQPGVQFLRIAPLLCEPECEFARDGKPLFRDDDHLSRTAAIDVVAPLIEHSLWR
jgi:hypothetical protein